MSITLYKFGKQWGIADASPFCVKLESFLKINNIAYTLGDFDMRSTIGKAPKKKIPFIVDENGKAMGDSSLIIEALSKEHGIDMEASLNDEQRAISHAFRIMIDENLYFILVYSRWIDDTGWSVSFPTFFKKAPAIIRGLIGKKIRKDVTKKAYAQGIARHSHDEIYHKGAQDLKALSTLLGDNTWFFGANSPGLLDLWAHAMVINIIIPPIETDLKTQALKHKNLCDHAHRLQEQLYGAITT